MKHRQNRRAQQTREQIRTAASRLFLQHGYLATSTDAILKEAGLSSKETLYRYYASKEDLFVDVLSHLTLEQPGFTEKLSVLAMPQDLPSLRQVLTQLSRDIMSMMSQPEYLALVRMIIAEAPRFPQLGTLFISTVPQRGLSLIMAVLQGAREKEIIADVDLEAVMHALLGGLLTYAIPSLVSTAEQSRPPALERADVLVDVMIRALTPQ